MTTPTTSTATMEKIVSLCKRRGFVFPGSEIYGGLANTWDYGPYGVELLNNLKKLWWKTFVQEREDMVGIDAAILMNPRVWEASGHVASFSDPLMDCKKCHTRVRGDKLIEERLGVEEAAGKSLKEISTMIKELNIKCPTCGVCDFTEARSFNLMFKTHQGVIEEDAALVYMRPETAQGIFVNFKNVQQTTRKRIPFGVGQIGKAFRNEITPGNFTFRTREFEQMEIEFFVHPDNWKPLYDGWREEMNNFFVQKLGLKQDKMRWRQHDADELSHYSKETWDVEYDFPFGWGELWGIAYRTDYDLKQHEQFSGEKLEYLDPETNAKYVPHVIEPTFGVTRTALVILLDAYDEEMVPTAKEGETEPRIVMRFAPALAPIKVAILPLAKKEPLATKAHDLYNQLKKHFMVEYDESGSIGKRYRRQDELGTPYCITVDFDTIEKDNMVTIRDRDSMKQERVPYDQVVDRMKAVFCS
ncbi:glycine--tRNA ligase [Candidatus Gracilibacteria bacterium]|nr:glycine--tRNA ligase [Candidatus Gracilibacteria bacterium]